MIVNSANLRIAVSQMQNSPHLEANASYMRSFIHESLPDRPDIVLFPECALTGFTPRARELDYIRVNQFLEEFETLSFRNGVCLVVPSVEREETRFYDTVWVFTPGQKRRRIRKTGLTDSERAFFTPGPMVERIWMMGDVRVGLLICKEASDPPWTYLNLSTPPELILWPAYWGHSPFEAWGPSQESYNGRVCLSVAEWNCPLIQSGYSGNAEGDSRTQSPQGLSVVIDSQNRRVFTASHAKPDRVWVNLMRDARGVLEIFQADRTT